MISCFCSTQPQALPHLGSIKCWRNLRRNFRLKRHRSRHPHRRAPIPHLRTRRTYRFPASAVDYWRDDLVSFIIGCSFTFEHPMVQAGVPVRHLEAGRNVPMYETSLACRPAGSLSGNLVVSLRMIPASQVADAVRITSRYPAVHGAPVHIGDPSLIGIDDINNPDFGDAPLSEPSDVPVFWACGVTPQAMVMSSKPPLAITHAPGHMLITDAPDLGFQVP